MDLVQIAEPGMGAIPAKADHTGFAMAVFGHDTFGFVFVRLFGFAVLGIVLGSAVQEEHHVRILFDRAGITQV